MTGVYYSKAIILAISWLVSKSAAVDYCKVCQDGSEILHPNVIIAETDQTCAELSEEAKDYSDPISCRYYHRYGAVCGCKNTPPSESFCGLCQRSNDQIDETLRLEGYDATCGTLKVDAAWNLLGTYSVENGEQSGIEQDNCDYYHHIGSLCGCKHNRPPENGCNLCVDGSVPLMPEKAITPYNAAEETCEALSLFTQYQQIQGTQECQTTQAVAGSYCGCAITPTGTDTCDYCPQGSVIREGLAPDIEFAARNRVFYFQDATCIKVAMLASAFNFPCGSAPRDFIESCCQLATELLNPEVFVQERPGAGQGFVARRGDRANANQITDSLVYRNANKGEQDSARLVSSENDGDNEQSDDINWDEFVFFSGTTRTGYGFWSSLVKTISIILMTLTYA